MKKYRVKINEKEFIVELEPLTEEKKKKNKPVVNVDITSGPDKSAKGSAPRSNDDPKKVFANLPGNIVKLLKKKSDEITANEGVLVLEAMKMENEIAAPVPGKIKEIYVSAGQKVNKDDLLFELV